MKKSNSETVGTIEHFKKYRWKDLNKRTINGSQKARLSRPNNSSYNKKQIRLELTRLEFYSFCEQNKELILNIYTTGDRPSVDRIDSAKHYSLDNMRIVPLKKNIGRRSY